MPYNYAAIREMMMKAFPRFDDLDVFCSDHYPNMFAQFAPGDSLPARVVKLLTHTRQTSAELDRMLGLIKQTRPDVYAKFQPQLSNEADEPDPTIATALKITKRGLLDETSFKDALDHIKVIHDYKQLHDFLHDLQFSWFPAISVEFQVYFDDKSEDKEARPNLIKLMRKFDTYILDMEKALDSLRKFNERRLSEPEDFTPKEIEQELQGARQLRDSLAALESGIKDNLAERVSKAKDDINFVIDTLPANINRKLYDEITLQTGRLRKLVQLMRDELRKPEHGDNSSPRHSQFRKGIAALELLIADVEYLKKEHDAWQSADNSLRMLNTFLQPDLAARKISPAFSSEWRKLRTQVKGFYENVTSKWAVELQKMDKTMSDRVDAASAKSAATELLSDKECELLNNAFQNFREAGKDRFLEVDKLLLSNCEKLEKIRDDVE